MEIPNLCSFHILQPDSDEEFEMNVELYTAAPPVSLPDIKLCELFSSEML